MDQPLTHHDAGASCACVTDHRPPVLEYQYHHIWPRYLGGPNVPENMIWICSTTHDSTHELIRLMVKAGRRLTYRECQELSGDRVVARYAYMLAISGVSQLFPPL